jgi:hypothetical protein
VFVLSQQLLLHGPTTCHHWQYPKIVASEELLRQGNIFRHEEIIEEVEVILLSAVSLDEESFQGKRTTNHLHSTSLLLIRGSSSLCM